MSTPDSDHKPARGWSGRFSEPVAELVKLYTASIDFDQRLADADISASLAHARMLGATGVLTPTDVEAIERGMQQIRGEIERGEFAWSRDLEDVHLNLEKRLIALIGDAGKRLHTGRSRNDQIATDLRLYVRSAIDALAARIRALRIALLDLAEVHAATVMPGFTHLQVAQPVTFGHHLLAYDAMLARDAERLADCRRSASTGCRSAAPRWPARAFPIDREQVARELGFEGLCPNSLDAVSDRDFAIEFAAAAALIMMHMSRFAEELVLWSSPRFGFVRLADRFCTGSSIMPQKKNPDVPELVRGKTGRVYGHLVALLTVMKAQPLAYNKDNQEDKEPRVRHRRHAGPTLAIMADLVAGRHHGRRRADARRGQRRFRHRDRSRRLPGAQGHALPRRARGRRAGGAPRRDRATRPGGPPARDAAALFADDRRRRLRRCSRSKARWPAAIIQAEPRRSRCAQRFAPHVRRSSIRSMFLAKPLINSDQE